MPKTKYSKSFCVGQGGIYTKVEVEVEVGHFPWLEKCIYNNNPNGKLPYIFQRNDNHSHH